MRHLARLALLFGHLAVIASSAVPGYGGEEPDWPRWLGPEGNGIAREPVPRPESLLPSPKIAWRTNVGYGYSSVCVKGAYLYTMGNVLVKGVSVDSVYCLSIDDGREVWRHSYPCRQGPFAGPRATPAFSRTGGDSLLYTISREGQLYCFDAATGEVRWQSDLVAEAGVLVPRWGIATSPIIPDGEDDLLLLNVGKYGLAADKTSGEIVWQSPEGLPGYASPVLYDLGGRRCMVCFGDSAARGVDVRTGRLLWTKRWFTRMAETSSDPVVRDGRVFLSTIYSKGCTLFDITDLTDGTPREVWLNKNLTTKFGTSVLYRGHLYGVHGNTGRRGGRAAGSVRCVDWETGELLWKHDSGFASLTVADVGPPDAAKLVILTEEGTLVIAEARTDGYHELARGRVLEAGERMREAKGKCWTAPVLCRGMVYCRNDRGDLVCVDVR